MDMMAHESQFAAQPLSLERVVGVFGMPRSGTSWIGQIFDSHPRVAFRLDPLFSYAFKNQLDANSCAGSIRDFFAAVHNSDDDFLLQTERRREGIYPTFTKIDVPDTLVFKTTRFHHLLEPLLQRSRELVIVAIVRHPCGAICSWLETPREFPSTADPSVEWRTGRCRKTADEEFWGFDDWKSVTLRHLELESRHPERFAIVRYEKLVASAEAETERFFRFCGLELSDQTRDFLQASHASHNSDSYSVFKSPSVVDRWRERLPPRIQEEILSEVQGTALERFIADE